MGINKGLVHHTQKLSEEAWADGVLNILTRDLCVVFYLYVKKVICDRGVIIVPFENKTDKQTKNKKFSSLICCCQEQKTTEVGMIFFLTWNKKNLYY